MVTLKDFTHTDVIVMHYWQEKKYFYRPPHTFEVTKTLQCTVCDLNLTVTEKELLIEILTPQAAQAHVSRKCSIYHSSLIKVLCESEGDLSEKAVWITLWPN